MSSARDNSLKQWVFDATDGAARLLKFRSGHAAPPTVVRHYGAGKLLLSAGELRQAAGAAAAGPDQLLLSHAAASSLRPCSVLDSSPCTRTPLVPTPKRADTTVHAESPLFLVVAAGEDRAFRAFSTIQDAQSRELSQHHTARRAKKLKIEERELKLEPVVALDACDVSGHGLYLV
jgi:hypothetical protein